MPEPDFRPGANLRLRLLVVALVPLLLAVLLFAAYFAHRGVSQAEHDLRQLGSDSARHLADALAYELFAGNLVAAKRLLDFERTTRGIKAIGVRDARRWLLVSGDPQALPPLAREARDTPAAADARALFFHPVRAGAAAEADPYLGGPADRTAQAEIVLVLDRGPVQRARGRIVLAAAGMGGFSLLLAAVLAWRLAGGVSRPLHQVIRTVSALAEGEPGARAPERSAGEIGQLERGVNRLAQALEDNRRDMEGRIRDATIELRGQKQAAEAAVQAKSRFLAAASHDLRQPLHALILLVTALRERSLDPETRRLAEHIDASAAVMASLLNSLLDLSKLDAGVVQAQPACFPVIRVLGSVQRQFAPLARDRNLRLVVQPTSLWARSDPALLERILSNLVANALRYTDRGRVVIGARRDGQDGVRLEVWDTGKGIPEAHLDRVFEEYFQLGNPERHRDKGLGLGLAIVSRLARLLGSEVSVRSRLGHGSRFGLRLPRCAPVDARATAAAPPGLPLPLENALVAFIDDDQAILGAMVEVFDQWGVRLAAATDADQLLAELEALGQRPDIILCDYRLADGRTGTEAVRALRAAFGADIPAALLTGDTAPETIQAVDASALPVLHKPLKPAKLRAFLAHLLAGPDTTGGTPAPNPPRHEKNRPPPLRRRPDRGSGLLGLRQVLHRLPGRPGQPREERSQARRHLAVPRLHPGARHGAGGAYPARQRQFRPEHGRKPAAQGPLRRHPVQGRRSRQAPHLHPGRQGRGRRQSGVQGTPAVLQDRTGGSVPPGGRARGRARDQDRAHAARSAPASARTRQPDRDRRHGGDGAGHPGLFPLITSLRRRQHMAHRTPHFPRRAAFLAGLLLFALGAAWATPPSHAPAHGWRKQHDPGYVGYTGKKWDQDYGIVAGRCNREAVGAVLGGAVGGVIGSQIGKGDGNKVAIIVGTALGAVLGARAGRDMDRSDAACIGHALELARDGQRNACQTEPGVWDIRK